MNFAKAQYTMIEDCSGPDEEYINEFKLGAKYQCVLTYHDDSSMKQVLISFTFVIRKMYTGYAKFDYFLNVYFPKETFRGIPLGYAWSMEDRSYIQSQLGLYLFRNTRKGKKK